LKVAILGHSGEGSGENRQLSTGPAIASRPIEEAKPRKTVDSSQMMASSITSVPQLQPPFSSVQANDQQKWNDIMIEEITDVLLTAGVQLENGLNETEIEVIEKDFGFKFPPDLRALLKHVLPVSSNFPNWRSGCRSSLESQIEEPVLGITMCVDDSDYWLPEWGEKPKDPKRALVKATKIIRSYPKLIPVFSHRYMPSEPHEAGNPILSVVGLDIIVYGSNLLNYFLSEFNNFDDKNCDNIKNVRGWSSFVLD